LDERQETNEPDAELGDHDIRVESVTESWLIGLLSEAIPDGTGLRSLRGFKLDVSANPAFRKVFFSAKCDCGTSALVSVEVARDKTMLEVEAALPSLVEKLESQAKMFYGMNCEMHTKMRMGPTIGPRSSEQGEAR